MEALGGGSMGKSPTSLTCFMCGRDFGTNSLTIHQRSCAKKRHDEQQLLPPFVRSPMPSPPNIPIPEKSSCSSQEEFDASVAEYNQAALAVYNSGLPKCGCGRTFFPESLLRHLNSCTQGQAAKAEFEQNQVKYPGGRDKPLALVCHICGREFGTTSLLIHQRSCTRKRATEQKKLPREQRSPCPHPPTTPIPTRSDFASEQEFIAMVDQYNEEAMRIYNGAMPECPRCGRTFSNHDRLSIHLRSCKAEGSNYSLSNTTPTPSTNTHQEFGVSDMNARLSETLDPSADEDSSSTQKKISQAERVRQAKLEAARKREELEKLKKERADEVRKLKQTAQATRLDSGNVSIRPSTSGNVPTKAMPIENHSPIAPTTPNFLKKGGGKMSHIGRESSEKQKELSEIRLKSFKQTGRWDNTMRPISATNSTLPSDINARPSSRSKDRIQYNPIGSRSSPQPKRPTSNEKLEHALPPTPEIQRPSSRRQIRSNDQPQNSLHSLDFPDSPFSMSSEERFFTDSASLSESNIEEEPDQSQEAHHTRTNIQQGRPVKLPSLSSLHVNAPSKLPDQKDLNSLDSTSQLIDTVDQLTNTNHRLHPHSQENSHLHSQVFEPHPPHSPPLSPKPKTLSNRPNFRSPQEHSIRTSTSSKAPINHQNGNEPNENVPATLGHDSELSTNLPKASTGFCVECGTPFPVSNAKFCMECGTKRYTT